MKNKKVDSGTGVFLIVGSIFTLVGIVYIGIAIGTFFLNMGSGMLMFRYIFGGIGLVLFIVGIACLQSGIRKRNRINRVISSGKYIMAEIARIERSYNVRINGYHPYVVVCQYQDISGNLHMFRSRYLHFDPEPFLKDQMVRVYVDAEDYKYYYVDIDEVLPNVIEH